MSDLNAVYSARILELAAAIPRAVRLGNPTATATAHSKLCGSTITVDVALENGRFVDFGQTVKACLLGQASASIVGRQIVGSTVDEFRGVAEQTRRMLKDGGAAPLERWADLGCLQPVREFKARHASTLLVFEAVEKALALAESAEADDRRLVSIP